MNIVIASDHAAVALKIELFNHIQGSGHTITDYGVDEGQKGDYPLIAAKLAKAVGADFERGILLCGTGIGMSISANRFPHIRAALCHDDYTARMSRQHNDSNVLVMGGRTTGVEVAKSIVDVWLDTPFEGGRHATRLALIEQLFI
ncbi:ribose 5-phosphate isomerase B [Deferribacterales bacterium RsTz2092]|nr:ribose 5-phosphate isomerase B [Deferribacterales bacterium]